MKLQLTTYSFLGALLLFQDAWTKPLPQHLSNTAVNNVLEEERIPLIEELPASSSSYQDDSVGAQPMDSPPRYCRVCPTSDKPILLPIGGRLESLGDEILESDGMLERGAEHSRYSNGGQSDRDDFGLSTTSDIPLQTLPILNQGNLRPSHTSGRYMYTPTNGRQPMEYRSGRYSREDGGDQGLCEACGCNPAYRDCGCWDADFRKWKPDLGEAVKHVCMAFCIDIYNKC